jgi:hypothetical protein
MNTSMHWIFQDVGTRSFVLFNDAPLSDEPITARDLELIKADGPAIRAAKSATWSANVYWFFIIRPDDILLLNTGSTQGVRCLKKSWKFIEEFVEH